MSFKDKNPPQTELPSFSLSGDTVVPQNNPAKTDLSTDHSSDAPELSLVDLGDDLLLETSWNQTPDGRQKKSESQTGGAPPSPLSIDEQLQNAKIFYREGFTEEAKHTYREVLAQSPGHPVATEALAEIQRQEELDLKQSLYQNDLKTELKKGFAQVQDQDTSEPIDVERLVSHLERDLGLSLFEESQAWEDTLLRLDISPLRAAGGGTEAEPQIQASDYLDWGIAYLEMGLPGMAARSFESALRQEPESLSTRLLLASAYLRGQKPFEAKIILEPLNANKDLDSQQRLEISYLLGRASQKLGQNIRALEWYTKCREWDSHYRDIEDRIPHLKKLCANERHL